MTNEEMRLIVEKVWEANKKGASEIAEVCFKHNSLPPAATLLIPGLARLLTELQKQSFFHGAAAVLYAIENSPDPGKQTVK